MITEIQALYATNTANLDYGYIGQQYKNMTILYDFEITKTPVDFTDKGYEMLEMLKGFVSQRLIVLQDKIDSEGGTALINLLNTMTNINPSIPMGLSYAGFTDELESKMESCFNENDMEYILSEIIKIKDGF